MVLVYLGTTETRNTYAESHIPEFLQELEDLK
jgi:hypothetical protein